MVFQIQTAGIYPFRLLYYNANDTAASVEWLTKNQFGSKALINSSTNAAAVKAYRSGPSFPYVSRLSSSPAGFTVDFTDAPGVSLNAGSIQTTLNGSSITPSIGPKSSVQCVRLPGWTPHFTPGLTRCGLPSTCSRGMTAHSSPGSSSLRPVSNTSAGGRIIRGRQLDVAALTAQAGADLLEQHDVVRPVPPRRVLRFPIESKQPHQAPHCLRNSSAARTSAARSTSTPPDTLTAPSLQPRCNSRSKNDRSAGTPSARAASASWSTVLRTA